MSEVDVVIPARRRDLGGFTVGRVLPFAKHRLVGPFIFFDHMGPVTFPPGQGIDVRPHPHIGLATVTYLFAGEILHRDSLGTRQTIRPGDVNWMVAGHGIVHSERTADDLRTTGQFLHGIQSWVALPRAHEDTAPTFAHHPAATLPVVQRPGVTLRIIAGEAFGARAPAQVFMDTLYVDAAFEAGATLDVPADHAERAVYLVEGAITVGDVALEPASMAVLNAGAPVRVVASAPSRVMLVGGAPIDGPRLIWWNLVASDEARMTQGKADWKAAAEQNWQGRFGMPPDESDYIPLPES